MQTSRRHVFVFGRMQVLGIYPTAIRRKVLRHLYLQPLRGCYLFKGCKQRFLDALLSAAKVELFMPGVQVGGPLTAPAQLLPGWVGHITL